MKSGLEMIPTVRPRLPELAAISDKFGRTLYQGNVTNGGEHVRRFERKLSEYLRAPTLAFNNGQTALMAMLMAFGVGPGDEVLMPSFTFCGTAAAVRALGAVPVFCEVDPVRLTIDPSGIAARVTPTTRAILGVDVYGICCDYAALEKIADYYTIPLLFDSAPAFGSMVNAFPTGTFGDAQIFSFHATKPFSTMEGGALCSKHEWAVEKAKRIRDFGQDEAREVTDVGLNGKMIEVSALVGIENLKDWREYRHKRTLRAFTYGHRLNQIEGLRTTPTPQDQWPIWTYMPAFVEPEFGKTRDEVLAVLHSKNVMARKYYQACHLMKPYANGQRLPVTEQLVEQVIALPFWADMTDDEMQRVIDAIEAAR